MWYFLSSESKHSITYLFWCVIFITAAIICAPFRCIFEYFYLKNPNVFRTTNNPNTHKKKVERIQEQIKQWDKEGRKGLLCSSRASWKQFVFRDMDKSKLNQIDVDLGDIIDIDASNMVLNVEPRMKIGTLTRKLLPMGWTIPVVPELEELTIGGLVCGAGIETSSHKYGLFFETCVGYEVVLPNGSCVYCSKTQNSDLFDSIPMSNGTIGFITAIKLPISLAKKYVELSYQSANTYESALELLKDSSHDFVEGLYFGRNKFVIVYGDMTDCVLRPCKIKTFTKWYDQFYHWDTEAYVGGKKTKEKQYVPLREYYHRHRRAYFWCWTNMAPYFRFSVVRYLFGWALPLNGILAKLIFTFLFGKRISTFMDIFFNKVVFFIQDYIIPINKMPEILEMITNDLEVYPVWLCPVRMFPSKGMIQPLKNQETLYVDIGVYGRASKFITNIQEIWKLYEKFTIENKGLIWFYTDHYLSRDDFDKMFSNKLYIEVRKKYKCNDAFPHVFDKVSRTT